MMYILDAIRLSKVMSKEFIWNGIHAAIVMLDCLDLN